MKKLKTPKFIKTIKDKNDKLWARFYNPNTKITKYGKWYSIVPLALIALASILILIQVCGVKNIGFNFGLDFTGGSVIEAYGFENTASVEAVRDDVSKYLRDKSVSFDTSTPKSENNGLGLSIKYQSEDGDIEKEIKRIIENSSAARVSSAETISASASGERIMTTFISIVVTLLAILIYVLFRFKFTSGVAAVVALIHDAFVVAALCVIFRVQINYSFVAALITVIVYSLNNTVVLFDRIRGKERAVKRGETPAQPIEQIVDSSIKETFARTLGTTITTLVPVIVLCCLPVPLIREFSLPILFGLIAGTFSTIYITTALYVRFENYRGFRKKYRERIQKQENLIAAK
jgi:preprotein translocase SecF subunit